MPGPTALLNKLIQTSGFAEFVRSTNGSPVIPSPIIIGGSKDAIVADNDFPTTVYHAFQQLDGKTFEQVTLSGMTTTDLEEGELFSATGSKIGQVVSFTRASPTTGTLIYKAMSVGRLIVTNSLLGGTSGAIGTVASVVSSVVRYSVSNVPMVREVLPPSFWDSTVVYANGSFVRHAYTPVNYGVDANKLILPTTQITKRPREMRVYQNTSGGNLTGSGNEPGAVVGWTYIGLSYFDDTRGIGTSGGSGSYSARAILDSTVEATDVDEVVLSTNGFLTAVALVNGSAGNVNADFAETLVQTVTTEVIGTGDGSTAIFYTDRFFVNPVTYMPTTTNAHVTVVGGVVASVSGENKRITLTAAPAAGVTITATYTTLVSPSVNEVIGTGDGSTTEFYALYPMVVTPANGVPADTDIIVKIDGVALTPTVDYVLTDPILGLVTLTAAPTLGEVVTVTYLRLPHKDASEYVSLGYLFNPVIQYKGETNGPVILSATYNSGTNTLTIDRDTSYAVDFTDITYDETKVFVEAPQVFRDRSYAEISRLTWTTFTADQIVLSNMGALEACSDVKVWVVKGSNKSNFYHIYLPRVS